MAGSGGTGEEVAGSWVGDVRGTTVGVGDGEELELRLTLGSTLGSKLGVALGLEILHVAAGATVTVMVGDGGWLWFVPTE